MKRSVVPVAVVMMAYASISCPEATPQVGGVWRLVSFEGRDVNGRHQFPMGKEVIGQLIYDPSGNMCATLMNPDRAKFASGDRLRGTDLEVRKAFEGYIAYFGTYTIDVANRTVTHHVDGSLYPNLVDTDLLRHYKVDGARLTLTTPATQVGVSGSSSFLSGSALSGRLTTPWSKREWNKVPAPITQQRVAQRGR